MIGRNRQTMADAALESSGSIEAVFALSRANGMGLDADISGVELTEVAVTDRQVVDHYRRNSIVPANAPEGTDYQEDQEEFEERIVDDVLDEIQ